MALQTRQRRRVPSSGRHVTYPVAWHGMVRQCARCWRVADTRGNFTIPAPPRLPNATHGYCPDCKQSVLAEIDAAS